MAKKKKRKRKRITATWIMANKVQERRLETLKRIRRQPTLNKIRATRKLRITSTKCAKHTQNWLKKCVKG